MRDLTKGNINKTFLIFALPLVFSGILSQMYGLVDSVIAGQYLGEVGLAATGACAPFITFVSSIIWGYSSGVSIVVGRLFGSGAYGRLKNTVLTQVFLIVAVSLLLGTLSILCYRPIFRLLQVDAAIWQEAFRYFAVYMAGFFLVVMNVVFMHLSSALGASMVPFVLSLISGVLNVLGNILSVTVLGMGVLGIALATVFSAGVTFTAYLVYFIKELRRLPSEEKTRLCFADCKWVLGFSLPTSLQQSMMYFATLALSPMVNALGPSATASYTVTNRIFEFNATVFYNSSRTLGSYVPQCIGAKKYTSIKKGFGACLLQSILLLLPILAVTVLLPEGIVSLFFKEGSEEGFFLSVLFVKNYLPFAFFCAYCNLMHHLYRGCKKMGLLMLSTGFSSVVRIVSGLFLTAAWGMEGFFLAWVLSWIAEALLNLLLYLFGVWVPREAEDVIHTPWQIKRKNKRKILPFENEGDF